MDIEHPDSIFAVSSALGKRLHDELGLEQLTLGVLHGESRAATTMVADWLRDQVLDDGSSLLGITFRSKHGGGHCWAYWLRRRDDDLDEAAMHSNDGSPILMDHPALLTVSRRFGIKIW